jgi:glycosyltransferase involved in cell wall biosynthesis
MFAFSVSVAFVTFHQIKKEYVFTVVPLGVAGLEIFFISSSSPTIKTFVGIISVLSFIQLAVVLILHVFYPSVRALTGSVIDYLNQDVFAPAKVQGKKRILVFNWRDTKHIWWGGAEIYVHELAKRWVRDGHEVTLFCGNDRKNKGEEVIDGVKIIRRGGFFTVYIWAVFYYLFKLRKECDVVVDSENGIPFFTPLFVTKPVVLLIHHVHKDIVLGGLKLPKYLLPFALIAKSLETWFMPFIYRNAKIVAVSPSTKSDLESLGFKNGVSVVNPGVEEGKFKKSKKTKVPSILYLGRLKHYKSIDTLIKAHKIVTKKYPKAKLMIAGFGDARKHLEKIVKKLDLKGKVKFLGRVTEKQKVKLLGKTWVFAYPSTMEGWGISVVEASASGTAVVASDVPGLRDSVRNPSSGLLVEQGNPVEFSNAIVKLIEDDKLRTKFETQGREWANTFTWDRSADKFLDVIEGKSEK